MITLHRLGHAVDTFQINPDVIVTIEANPDTVITITNGLKIVVAEPPERVADAIQAYRADVLSLALIRRHELRNNPDPVKRISPLRNKVAPVHLVADAPANG